MDVFSGIVDAILGGLIGTIAGAVIGGQYTMRTARLAFTLDFEARRTAEEARRQEEIQRVRTLLRLETARNLEVLEDFWQSVTSYPVIEGGGTETELQKRLRLVQHSLRQWGHLMWVSQAAQLPSVMDEGQIKQMYAVHADLEVFTALREAIEKKLSTQRFSTLAYNYDAYKADQRNAEASGNPFPFEGVRQVYAQADEFNKDTAAMWFECGRIHGEVSQQCRALIQALS